VELFARWGVLEKFFSRGAGKRVGHEFRTATGEPLLAATYDELPVPYPYFLVFNHDLIAELFLEIAAENPNFIRLQPVVARNFEIGEDGVSALSVELPDGVKAVIKPHLVVGADGTNSTVRATLRFTADEHQYIHPMVAMFGPRPAALKPLDYFFRYSSRTGMLVIQQRMNNFIKVTLPVGAEGIAWWKKSTKQNRTDVLRRRAELLLDVIEIGLRVDDRLVPLRLETRSDEEDHGRMPGRRLVTRRNLLAADVGWRQRGRRLLLGGHGRSGAKGKRRHGKRTQRDTHFRYLRLRSGPFSRGLL